MATETGAGTLLKFHLGKTARDEGAVRGQVEKHMDWR